MHGAELAALLGVAELQSGLMECKGVNIFYAIIIDSICCCAGSDGCYANWMHFDMLSHQPPPISERIARDPARRRSRDSEADARACFDELLPAHLNR